MNCTVPVGSPAGSGKRPGNTVTFALSVTTVPAPTGVAGDVVSVVDVTLGPVCGGGVGDGVGVGVGVCAAVAATLVNNAAPVTTITRTPDANRVNNLFLRTV